MLIRLYLTSRSCPSPIDVNGRVGGVLGRTQLYAKGSRLALVVGVW